jgi:hypothetical protein
VPVWRTNLVARIGSLNDVDAALTNVQHVVIGRDHLYVAQPADYTIRVYDFAGRLVRSIGQKGKGPAEIEGIRSIGLHGDTLYVSDSQLGRVSFFTLDGKFVRSLRWLSTGFFRNRIGYGPTPPQVLLSDGSALVDPGIAIRVEDARTRRVVPKPVLRVSQSGQIIDTVLWRTRPAPTVAVPSVGTGTLPLLANPFEGEPLHALSADGSGVVLVDRAVSGRKSGQVAFRVVKKGIGKGTGFSKSFLYRPSPMTPGALSRVSDDLRLNLVKEGRAVGRFARLTSKRIAEALRSSGKVPATQLPVTAVIAAQDGRTWLKRETGSDPYSHWDVLDTTGTLEGRANLPENEILVAASRDIVVTVAFAAFDVPLLSIYGITAQRPAASRGKR